jgi:hypothetical protein
MEKIKSFHHGNIWINVFSSPEGELSLGIRRSYPSKEGWKYTSFLRPREQDLHHLIQALSQFLEWDNRHKAAGWPE